MSHSIQMRNCKIVAVGLLHKKVPLNTVKKILANTFVRTKLLPGNAIRKALGLARFGSEENYKRVKQFKRYQVKGGN